MSHKYILLVEDEPDARETLKELLELEGYHVITADNGAHAFEQLERFGQPCIVFLDLMMPIMNGWDFLKLLQQRPLLSKTPVVVVSAAADVGMGKDLLGCPLMRKPTNVDQLLAFARDHCAGAM